MKSKLNPPANYILLGTVRRRIFLPPGHSTRHQKKCRIAISGGTDEAAHMKRITGQPFGVSNLHLRHDTAASSGSRNSNGVWHLLIAGTISFVRRG